MTVQIVNGPTYTVTVTNPNSGVVETVEMTMGAPGPEGPQGPAGPEGPQGPAGDAAGAVFRGEWSSEQVLWAENLADGLGAEWSTAVTGNGVAAAVTPAVYPPGDSRSIEMYLNTIGTTTSTELTLDVAALGLTVAPTRIEFWIQHTAGVNQSWQTQTDVKINGSKVLDKNGAFAWEKDSFAIGASDVIAFKEYGLWGAESAYDSGRVYIGGIAIYGAADPYMLGQFVTHGGKLWKSLADNNSGTPGTSGWVEVPLKTSEVVLLEVGETAANVPAGTPVGALIFQKG